MDVARYCVAVSDSINDMRDNSSGHAGEQLRYQVITGPDTAAFCERVSVLLADGYVLHGSPAITFGGTTAYVAQAVVLP